MAGKYPVYEVPESAKIKYKGEDGGDFTWFNYEGHFMAILPASSLGIVPDIRDVAPKLSAMQCRNDDIFLCAYQKAGTHWVWEITNMLITGKLQYLTMNKEEAMLEFHFPEEFDNFQSPRVFNTHLPFHFLPKDVSDKRLPIIFVQRNPKDVMVSFYNMLKAIPGYDTNTFRDHIGFFMKNRNWFNYTRQWEKDIANNAHIPIHMIYYESLKKDPVGEISRLAKFLGQDRGLEFIQKVAEMCKFTNMKKANEEIKNKTDYVQKLMQGMYRKGIGMEFWYPKISTRECSGEIGDWKNWFTVAQSEEMDALYQEIMKGSKFEFAFT